MNDSEFTGACTCGQVQYKMLSKPMYVHCCHCTWCQRETGTAFALNAMIEAERVQVSQGAEQIEVINTPSNSGKGQQISRCKSCKIALWSNYAGAGEKIRFVRVGTLHQAASLPPDIHIFTSTKQPWLVLPPEMPAVPEYYKSADYWSAESLARRDAVLGKGK